MKNWNELTSLTKGKKIIVERVRLEESDIRIEGDFELPSLVQLSEEEQVFISAFLQTHGSIKEMEKLFGISYPTVKNRLNQISKKLDFVITNPPPSKNELLDRLENGEISVDDVLEGLNK